jgi:thymidylate kinase
MWIAIEGPDRVGKKTQATMLADAIAAAGVSVTQVEVPYNGYGATWSYRLIYRMLNTGAAKRWPLTFQLVHMLNKLMCQLHLAFNCADVAVLDRWHMSSVVYGIASGVAQRAVRWMGALLARPTVTIVLLKRTQHTVDAAPDSYESDVQLQDRVRSLYGAMCDGDAIIAIDADGTREDVAQRIRRAVNPHLKLANHYIFNELQDEEQISNG